MTRAGLAEHLPCSSKVWVLGLLRVHFLGVAGAGGPPLYARNCYLVETKHNRLLLDIGEGCGWRLSLLGLSLCDIDYIYVSHSHFDHYSGLFDAGVRAVIEKCSRGVRIAGSPDVLSSLDVNRLAPSSLPISIVRVQRDLRLEGGDRLTLVESTHVVPTYGVLLETSGGETLYYTADTEISRSVVEASKKADIVLAEATIPDGLEEIALSSKHMTVSQALSLSTGLKEGGLLAIVHRSIESEKQLLKKQLPKRVVVPSDMCYLSL